MYNIKYPAVCYSFIQELIRLFLMLFKVHKGLDAQGQDMTGLECDTVDEIEALVSRFECDTLQGRRENKIEDRAERTFEDLLKVSA